MNQLIQLKLSDIFINKLNDNDISEMNYIFINRMFKGCGEAIPGPKDPEYCRYSVQLEDIQTMASCHRPSQQKSMKKSQQYSISKTKILDSLAFKNKLFFCIF